ncbi:MAG: sulfatase-like hydrolase/transferase, partial [Chloroflexota bacterium]|nr:sulfatase-like hydrolase/transferase [Chloroflexota bacterium]
LYIEVNLEEPHRPYSGGGVQPDSTLGVFVPAYLPDTDAAREEFAALQGAIHEADSAVGRIRAALEDARLTEQTLFVFTTDHGVAMPRAKCTLYDPGIGVALLLRWPAGGIVGGAVFPQLVSNVDMVPTLLAAAAASVPQGLQGHSLLPLLRHEHYEPQDAVFAEKTYHSYYDPMRTIRTERYKLIRNFETCFLVECPGDVQLGAIYRSDLERYVSTTHPDTELYDLQSDPLEQRNLSGDGAYEEVESELNTRLWRWMEQTGDPLLKGPVPSPAHVRSMAAWNSVSRQT